MIPFLTFDNTSIQDYPALNEFICEYHDQKTKNVIKHNTDNDMIYTFSTDALQFYKEDFENQTNIDKEKNKYLSKFKSIVEFEKKFYNQENIEFPNETVLNKLDHLLDFLLINNIKPYKIAPSVEEGICVVFKNKNEKLHFEIYNDGDMGYIIEDYINKKIISYKDFNSIEEAINDIVNYNKDELS